MLFQTEKRLVPLLWFPLTNAFKSYPSLSSLVDYFRWLWRGIPHIEDKRWFRKVNRCTDALSALWRIKAGDLVFFPLLLRLKTVVDF